MSLCKEVAIVPIPKREEYTQRVKQSLWTSGSELYENAVRNSIEFAAEGWDWRKAVEECNMIPINGSDELIHPIHFYNISNVSSANESISPQQQITNVNIFTMKKPESNL